MKKYISSFYNKIRNYLYDFDSTKLSLFKARINSFFEKTHLIKRSTTHVVLLGFIKMKVTNRRREAMLGYLFISLWLIGFLVFTFYPMIYSFYLTFRQAFFNLQVGIYSNFIGFKNYQSVLSDARLLPLFASYAGRLILSVPLIIIFAILIALLINQPIKGKGLFRTIFFLPVVIATGPVIGELISQRATTLPSLSNSFIASAVIENLPNIIATPIITLFNSMLLVLWYAGIPVLVFLAGLQKIDRSIYEAAEVDGASPWDTFWKITLPSIKGLINVNIIYIVVSMSLYVEAGGILDLAKIHMLQGAPDSTLWLGYGYAATISWIYFFIMVLIILIYVGLLSIGKRRD